MWDNAAKGFMFNVGDVVVHKANRIQFVVVSRAVYQGQSGAFSLAYDCSDGNGGGVTEMNQTELEKPS